MLARLRVMIALALSFGLATMLPVLAQEIPKSKQTALGKYLDAKQTFDLVNKDRAKVLFVDVRTSAELMFVGMTQEVDAHVPFVEMLLEWDAKADRYRMAPNAAFVQQIETQLARKGLTKADPVILMCRSGERSARAVNALAAAGFSNAYSQTEGFEGDLSKDGQRSINGWKNAGLPWDYKLDKTKLARSAP
ncbi:MAG TPA: rhodanese-like domain-containing protein [Hyphomicrobium sp.]|nr:rhodanese-like domain-containing protein [Hyphomicrobium sp.]